MKPTPRNTTALKITIIATITLTCIFIPTLTTLILPATLIYWISQKISYKLNRNNQQRHPRIHSTRSSNNNSHTHTYTPPKPLTTQEQQQQWKEITDNLKNNH